VIPQGGFIDEASVRQIRGAGKKILVWTVNAVAEMRRFADWGVDGIISDHTSLLCETLKPQLPRG
jgi:glycerophosphoryl diester phosphodiesterase